MTSPFVLRVVAILALVQGLGHGTLFVGAKPTRGADEVAVVTAMKSRAFTFF